jgi:hypothetical protein
VSDANLIDGVAGLECKKCGKPVSVFSKSKKYCFEHLTAKRNKYRNYMESKERLYGDSWERSRFDVVEPDDDY